MLDLLVWLLLYFWLKYCYTNPVLVVKFAPDFETRCFVAWAIGVVYIVFETAYYKSSTYWFGRRQYERKRKMQYAKNTLMSYWSEKNSQ